MRNYLRCESEQRGLEFIYFFVCDLVWQETKYCKENLAYSNHNQKLFKSEKKGLILKRRLLALYAGGWGKIKIKDKNS